MAQGHWLRDLQHADAWFCSLLLRAQGVCDNTGKPHVVLKGQNGQGVFWTLIAEPYPELLCRSLARGVDLGHCKLRSRPMAAILARTL